MLHLHKEILTERQHELLGVVKEFDDAFGLVGGTAIALHIGHRESIDFDLFTKDPATEFDTSRILKQVRRHAMIETVIRERDEELTLTITGVQFTFYHFEHIIPYNVRLRGAINIPDLLTLAAMKAYAHGQRAKWKDYVDIYFILRDHYSLEQISNKAKELFKGEFNERLWRQQISYFDDMRNVDPVTFKPGFEVSDDEIKKRLIEWSLA